MNSFIFKFFYSLKTFAWKILHGRVKARPSGQNASVTLSLGDRVDEGVHAGVFLGGSRSREPLDPVRLGVCLAGEAREIGGVAARAFCCGGVGCERYGSL